MKTRIGLCILMAVAIATASFTKCYSQTNEFPPVQNFLDKIAGKKFEENMMQKQTVSQLLTNNSYTWCFKNNSADRKDIYSNLHWDEFVEIDTYSLKNEDKYIECRFRFGNKIKVSLYNNEVQFHTNQSENYFNCFILAKDKKAFLKVVDDWKAAKKK